MSNVFTKFAAGNDDGGWLTTKRKGVDDDAIAHDKEMALQKRKERLAKNRKPKPQKPKKKPPKKKKKYDFEDDFIVDDDDDESELEAEFSEESSDGEDKEVVRTKRKAKTKKKPEVLELSSDEDDFFANRSFKADKNRRAALKDASNRHGGSRTKTSRHFQEEKKTDSLSSSSDESILEIGKPKLPSKRKITSTALDDSDSDDDFLARKPSATTFNSKKRSAAWSSDLSNDLVDNDDELMALASALNKSEKTFQKERKRLKKKTKKKKQKVVVNLSPDSPEASPEDDAQELLLEESSQGEEEQDAYNNDKGGEEEASSVLRAANQLSAKVIQAMTGWSAKDEEKDGDAAVPAGIIVDGALAMLECSANQGKSSSHAWISQEEMKTVCPNVTLADYQLIGVNWIALLHGLTCDVDGKKGGTNVNGVLADEMGLGKTVQTICFLAWLRHHNRQKNGYKEQKVIDVDDNESKVVDIDDDSDASPAMEQVREDQPYARPHLIVVPASVLANWEREFETFCPDMHVIRYHGSMVEREELRKEMRRYMPGQPNSGRPPLDVVLTTFSYFSSEKSDDRSFLRKFKFDYLVVDEAHCLKNPHGARYRNLDKFDTSHRLLLTGTPVQNSPQELMSLLCFLMPLFSRSKGGFDYGEDETKNDGGESMLQHFVSLESNDLSKDDANEAAYKKLKQLFAPFVLRRRKVDALKQLLPPKTHKLELVPFDEATRTVYDSILATHIQTKENGAAAQQHLFTALRKAANHPLLLRSRHTTEEAKEHLAKHLYQYGYFGRHETCKISHVRQELEKFSDFGIHCAATELIEENKLRREELGRYLLQEQDLFSSPKFERLRVLLPELIEKGHRILIFSQWTLCMDLLGCLMESLDLAFLRLDGSTNISERQEMIDEFNNNSSIPVFLLSTRAGGMGINLTAADTCIIHDLDFNPFNDIQAEDRCHRIGQKKPVTVYKMVTENTVDADIHEMQQKKSRMNAAILDANDKTKQKKEEEAARMTIVQTAVNRFHQLTSPKAKNKTNDDDDEMDI